jgi:hypothetical protein
LDPILQAENLARWRPALGETEVPPSTGDEQPAGEPANELLVEKTDPPEVLAQAATRDPVGLGLTPAVTELHALTPIVLTGDAGMTAVVADALIELKGQSAVKSGSLVLLVDGEPVYSRELSSERKKLKRFFKKMIGSHAKPFDATFTVPPGEHAVTARLEDHVRSLTFESTIEIDAEAGARIPLALFAGRSKNRPLSLEIDTDDWTER